MRSTTKRRKAIEGVTIAVRSLYVLKAKYMGKAHKFFLYLHSFNHVLYGSECRKVYCTNRQFSLLRRIDIASLFMRKLRTKESDESHLNVSFLFLI